MSDFKNQFGFIIFFIVLVLFVTMTFGAKVANYFLVLVLLGMLVTNAEKVTALIAKFSQPGSGTPLTNWTVTNGTVSSGGSTWKNSSGGSTFK